MGSSERNFVFAQVEHLLLKEAIVEIGAEDVVSPVFFFVIPKASGGFRPERPWLETDAKKHINELELQACLFRWKTFTANRSNLSIAVSR